MIYYRNVSFAEGYLPLEVAITQCDSSPRCRLQELRSNSLASQGQALSVPTYTAGPAMSGSPQRGQPARDKSQILARTNINLARAKFAGQFSLGVRPPMNRARMISF